MFLTLFAVLILVLIFFYLYQTHKYRIIDEYPGPTQLELIKFALLPKSTKDSYDYFISLSKKYGSIVKIWLKPFRPTLYVSDQRFIKHILLSKEHVNKASLFHMLKSFLGDGLPIITDINIWKKERKTFSHVLNNQFIVDYVSTFKTHALKLGKTINENLNKPVDLQKLLLRHGLNIIYDLLLNEDISEQDDRVNRYSTALKTFLEIYFDRINSPFKMNDNIFKLTDNYKIWTKCCKESKEFVETTLKEVIESKRKSSNDNQNDRKDFIDLLLESNMSYERILANLGTFVVAGSDTISSSVGFALYEIAKKPELQEKIYEEYISILGQDKNVSAEFKDIQKMTFTESVIKEALRMHPPVPFIFRTLKNSADIDGKMIPADIDIIFSIIDSHYLNFENSLEFTPERFLTENANNIPANAYLPFSLGPRDCIGKLVGLVEAKFLISYIIRHFTVHPISDHELDLSGEIVLISKNGVPVIFKERMN